MCRRLVALRWCGLLQVHGVYGAGVHRLGSLPGGLGPGALISQKGPDGHSQWGLRLAVSSWKCRRPRGWICGARGHGDPLLDLLRGPRRVGASCGRQRGGFLPASLACAGPGQAALLPPLQGVCRPWAHGCRAWVCPVAWRWLLADTRDRGWRFTHLNTLNLDVKKKKSSLKN